MSLTYILSSIIAFLLLQSCTSTEAPPLSSPEQSSSLQQGNQYAQDGLYREAIDQYQNALRINPKDASTNRNLGMVFVKIGSYKAAIRHLEASIVTFDNDFETNYYLGEAYRADEDYASAIYRYQKALLVKANEPRALKALSWSYFRIRYYKEALTSAQTLYHLDPKDSQNAIILARTYLKLRQFPRGLSLIRRAKADSTAQTLPYLLSVEGDLLATQGRCPAALKVFAAALKEQPLLAGALLGVGRCHLESQKFDEAITYLERALRIRPNLAEGYLMLGKAFETKKDPIAKRHYKNFIKHAATDPELLDQIAEIRSKLRKELAH